MKKSTFVCGLLGLAGVAITWAQSDQDVSFDTAMNRNLTIFNAVAEQLAQNYVDSVRPDEAFDLAIAGLLYTVDPYTEYYNSSEIQRLEQMTTGSFGGIGSFIHEYNGETYIGLPMENAPAYKAGMKAGDHIVRVNDVDVRGKGSEFTIKQLKGDPGTSLKIEVIRPYAADSILSFELIREKLQDKSVPYYGVIDGIGYVKLTSFMEKSGDEVKEALESFRKNPEVKGVILDLRDNGGGLVGSAVDILGMFLPSGTKVLETKGKYRYNDYVYRTEGSPILRDMPLVVMINGNSASASEITAGAIQDLDRGVIVGRRSFGKGLVQSTLSLPFDGALKVTTSKYHLPSGRLIQALDYSKRREDGSVAPTPDSLTHEFKTHKGRIVRDGGGLVPDSVIEDKAFPRVLYNLIVEDQIFKYATKFASENPSIPSPAEFRITDEIFDDFIAFVDTAKVKGNDAGKRLLDELEKTAKADGLLTEDMQASLSALAPMVAPDLSRDIRNKRPEIEEYLGREIVRRYYGTSGEEEYSLRFDNEFKVALDILKDKNLYESFLKP